MEKRSCRAAYGEALRELGCRNPNVVVLEADLGKSTMSAVFGEAFPERYFQMGIAEQNMLSTAAGLALAGKIPFANSFAVFSSGRPYDQIRSSICVPGCNVNICGSSAGLSDYGDGKTHQSIDDIALMRVLPHMTVLSPVDAVETAQMVQAMAELDGPCYIRINRNELPVYTDHSEPYRIGQMKCLREGSDVAVFATGVMVSVAMEAAQILEQEGISLRVVNLSTIKPLNTSALMGYCQGVKAVLTAEEHSVMAGMGSAVCEALSASALPVDIMGIEDSFGRSAENYACLLECYGLTSGHMADRIRKLLK